jgi:hypothetical protein
MNINKDILKKKCLELFESNPNLINVNWLIYLVNEVINNNPTKDFTLK